MNAVFIHIPRTAGRSIEESLNIRMYRRWSDIRKKTNYCGIVTFGHLPLCKLIENETFNPEAWFIFTFVRNPYDRAVSLWRFNRRRRYFRGPFDDFCHNLDGMHQNIKNNQADWLHGVDIGFVGRYENLDDDFKTLCGLLDIGEVKLKHINISRHNPWQEYYTEELSDVIYKHYQQDFEKFGYEHHPVPHR